MLSLDYRTTEVLAARDDAEARKVICWCPALRYQVRYPTEALLIAAEEQNESAPGATTRGGVTCPSPA